MTQHNEKLQEALSTLQKNYDDINYLREAKKDLFMIEFELLRLYCEQQANPPFEVYQHIDGLRSLYIFLDDLEKATVAQVS